MQINKVEICGVNTSELPVLKNNQMMEMKKLGKSLLEVI